MECIFSIIKGEATSPRKYRNGKCVLGMNPDEVGRDIGIAPIAGYPAGHIRYLVSEIIAFGGELRDVDPAVRELTEEDEQLADSLPDNEDMLDEWENEVLRKQPEEPEDLQPADIEKIILTEKPQFKDIPYDFPELLNRRKSGETWIEIANSIGTRSTILSAAWLKYKKRVADQRGGAGWHECRDEA